MRRPKNPRYCENWIGNGHSASVLAASISEFWQQRGYPTVKVWVEDRGGHFAVRSNLVNGIPPRFSLADAKAQLAA